MYTVYTYILYVRECVRIYSGISKRIPSLGSPSDYLRVESAHTTSVRRARVDRVRVRITPPRIVWRWLHLTKFIFGTYRSPHIGSKLRYVRATRGVG